MPGYRDKKKSKVMVKEEEIRKEERRGMGTRGKAVAAVSWNKVEKKIKVRAKEKNIERASGIGRRR